MTAVDRCRHGHAGWMYQRVMFDGRRNRWYACWVCRECERLRNQECSRRRRQERHAELVREAASASR